MVRSLTVSDTARLAWHLGLPMLLGGVVAPNPRFTPYLVRRQTTARAFAFLERVRQEYGPRVWMWLPPAWTLLVLDADGIAKVLDSDANFADPPAKAIPLSRVTPHGVIVSRGDAWRHRRMLNDDALAFGQPLHPGSEEFLNIAEDEVERLLEHRPDGTRVAGLQRTCRSRGTAGHIRARAIRACPCDLRRARGVLQQLGDSTTC